MTICVLLALAAGRAAHAQNAVHAVLVVHRVINAGDKEAAAVTAHCILPATNRYQEVLDVQIDPEPSETHVDALGQEVISVPLGPIPPGESRAVRVMIWTRLKPVNVPLLAAPAAGLELRPEIRDALLEDGFLLNLAKLRPIAEKAIGRAATDVDKARKLFEYMSKNCQYGVDEHILSADAILGGKPASCSELAYTYIGLCRSVGIPARVVSAYVNREGAAPSTDWQTHRWAEFFSEGFGWVPADPTNRINNPTKNFFGRQDGKYLTVIDDGVPLAGGQPDPGWQVFLAGAEPRDIPLATGRSAYWRVSVHRPGETKAFQSACSALREADPVKRRAAIEEWDRQRPLMKTGFLLEALFDADADLKKLAAAALGKSGDVSALLPLAMLAKDQTDKAIKQAFLAAARKILDAQDDAHRATAVNELTKSRTDEALELLDGIWNDTARDVRKMAAQTFYRFGDKPKVHEAYRSLSRDDDEFIRIQAALRWSRTGSKEATELVVDLLESEVRWDREQALNELSKRAGDRFAFDVKAEPGSKRNEEALAKWKAWLKRAPADTQPAEQ